MDTKEVLEIILCLCIGWMIYSILFMREGMAELKTLKKGIPSSMKSANRKNRMNQQKDRALTMRRVKNVDGLAASSVDGLKITSVKGLI